MVSKEFEVQYKRLNPKQREAVDAIEGPVMVIAGPGTGKTSILTLRIANILNKTDTAADSILALTFTESGVHSMRQKLVEVIGATAYKVKIHTFHSFCNELIQKYPEEFPRIVGSLPAGILDQIQVLEDILEKGEYETLKPHGNIFYYVRPLLGAISDIKRENISVEKFAELLKGQEDHFHELPEKYHEKGAHKGKLKGEFEKIQKRMVKNRELLTIYEKYESKMREKKLYDYDDMIMEAVTALEHRPEFLLILQEEHQYILADEHQDANNAQNKLLELLSGFHEDPNLFIVGDEKQAIYRFQGASLENFLFFKKKYPSARLVSLEENYRSPQSILDASHGVILNNETPTDIKRVRLVSSRGDAHKKVFLASVQTPTLEMAYVAEAIAERIASGTLPHDIAVIYRDNGDAAPLSEELRKLSIPCAVLSDDDAFRDSFIRRLLWLVRAIENLNDSELLANVLHFDFLKLPHLEVWKVIRFSGKERYALIDVISSAALLEKAGIEGEPKAWLAFSKLFLKWGKRAKNDSALAVIEAIARESGFLSCALSRSDAVEKLEKYDAVLKELRRLQENHKNYAVRDFILFLETLERHGVRVGSKQKPRFASAVSLMTAHRSKGLEFDHVYIIGARDGHWGNKRSRELFTLPIYGQEFLETDDLEDERRLFYVALTRARLTVTITYSEQGDDGKAYLPSVFVEEMDSAHVEELDTAEFERTHAAVAPHLVVNENKQHLSLRNQEYLRRVFLEEGLSVTALNNYLECPWKYFFTNLVRIPQTPEQHQLYGNAVHAALKEFYDALANGKVPTETDLTAAFERSLLHQPLSEHEFRDSLKRGIESLKAYFRTYDGTWFKEVITEFTIAGVFVEIAPGVNLLIKGRLDKIELLDGANRVNVVDYKTGKPKSRNAILGETKDSEGNIKRQLDFYKLLLDEYEKGKYEMVSGEIDFVEPAGKSPCKRERFEITADDAAAVRKEVVNVGNEIHSFAFWDRHCEAKGCEYCERGLLLRSTTEDQ